MVKDCKSENMTPVPRLPGIAESNSRISTTSFMNCVLGQKETLKQKKAQCTISRQHAQIFPGPQRNARGARPWPPWVSQNNLPVYTARFFKKDWIYLFLEREGFGETANRITEVTGVKTEFWKHVGAWDTVGDQLALYDSNTNKPGLCKILRTEAKLPKPHLNFLLPLRSLGFSPVTSASPFPPTWRGGYWLSSAHIPTILHLFQKGDQDGLGNNKTCVQNKYY